MAQVAPQQENPMVYAAIGAAMLVAVVVLAFVLSLVR